MAPCRGWGLGILLAALTTSVPLQLWASDPLLVIVQTHSEVGDQLWERLGGHTSDIDVVLVQMPASGDGDRGEPNAGGANAGDSDAGSQMAHARRLADAGGARAVVWLRATEEPVGMVVYIADIASERLFTRQIRRHGPSAAAGSAMIEAAALVVRSALRALVAGAPIGVEVDAPVVVPESVPPTAVANQSVVVAPRDAVSRRGMHVALQWAGVFDRSTGRGHRGWSVRGGLDRRAWSLAMSMTASPAVILRDERSRIRLARYSGLVSVERRWRLTPWMAVTAGMGGGAFVYTRSTTVRDGALMAAPAARLPGGLLRPLVRGRLRVPGCRCLGLALEWSLSVDAAIGAPTLGYEIDGVFLLRKRLRLWQPRMAFGLYWRWPWR